MKVISLVNQKGGVAKTTTAIALGDGLARRGKKVLLVDFDPQGNLTTSFALTDDANSPAALRMLGLDGGNFSITQVDENLHVITSEIGLERANTLLASKVGRERYLSRALSKIKDMFDYVIIDSNPSLSIITINVLTASDYVLIPFKPEFNSFKGIDLLLESIADVQEIKPQLEILGYVVTMADKRRTSTGEAIDYIKERSAGVKVFDTIIRVAVAGADAPSHAKSVYAYAPKSTVAKDYESLTDEILREMETKL